MSCEQKNTAPKADIDIHISSEDGITYADSVQRGSTTIAVHFHDQMLHEHFVGHDVNLVELNEKYNLDELLKWMNWSVPGVLESPGPEIAFLLGSVNDLPEKHTGFFLRSWCLVSMLLLPKFRMLHQKNMFKVFTIE